MPADLQPIARYNDHVQHTHASTGRTIGAVLGSVVGAVVATVVIVGAVAALTAIEAGTFGAATPFVIAAGAAGAGLLGAGTAGYTISAFSNVGADLGRMITEDEGQITTGEPSVLIGVEQTACAHIESNVSCKLHKHLSSPNPAAPDVIDPAQEQLVQGSQTVRVGRGRHPVSRVGSKGTCGFAVGQGCKSVIVGGPTVTIGTVGDGDDPNKKAFDDLKDISGKLMLAGICLLSLSNPMLLVEAGVGVAVISTGLSLLPEGLPRDVGEAVVSMLPLLKARDVFGGKDPVDPTKTDTDTDPDTKPDEETKLDTDTKPDTERSEPARSDNGEGIGEVRSTGQSGQPTNLNPKPTPSTIEEGEQLIRNQDYETAYVWDQQGNLLFQKEGEVGKVVFSQPELAQMNDGILSHNHRNGGTFSPADLDTALRFNLSEIRAVTDTQRFSLSRPDTGWSINDLYNGQLGKTYTQYFSQAAKAYDPDFNQGILTKAEYDRLVTQDAIHNTVRDLGLDYKEENW